MAGSKIINKLTSVRMTNPDAAVPQAILESARGLAFMRIAKVGFVASAKLGTGWIQSRDQPRSNYTHETQHTAM